MQRGPTVKFRHLSLLQIIPFLALGLGVDDMFLLAHTYAENANNEYISYKVSNTFNYPVFVICIIYFPQHMQRFYCFVNRVDFQPGTVALKKVLFDLVYFETEVV